jgi:predicted amidophosphoribosyltransferase
MHGFPQFSIEGPAVSTLPPCPKCNSEYTYEDGDNYVCPECAHEWSKHAATEAVEAHAYCQPLHRQRAYLPAGNAAIKLFVTEKLADRAVALPFHGHLTEEQVAFVVGTMKDASVNVGAGAAIYL